LEEPVAGPEGGEKGVDIRKIPHQLAIEFLGKRFPAVAGSQASLDVGYSCSLHEADICACECARCISLHQNNVWCFHVQDAFQAGNGARRQTTQGLAVRHQIQIMIRPDFEEFQDLIQHRPVLCCNHHNRSDPAGTLEFLNHGSHLDGLRASSENENGFHEL
jgi:hypothetical protein